MPNPNRSIYDFYNITDIIGEGTFSTVTVANDINKKEDKYAIKIISKEVLDRERRTYVDWEISILSKCQHPNIIKFYEHFESDEDICLVLEWIPNGDLFDRIVKKGVFSEDEAKQAMKSLLSAVEYLHDKSVVHRDIKPENILYTTPKDIKLADFGLAKFYEESIGLELACGTLAYSAPEITNNQIYRKSVDMWSCGCILYFILFGRPPFYSDDEDVMFELITKGQWSFPVTAEHKYSDQVKDLIKSLLETDPNKRLTVKQSLNHPWIANKSDTFTSVIRQPSSSTLSASSSSSCSSSSSLKTIIEQQEYNYNHQQLQHNNILHSSSSSNSHSINSSSNGGRHASSNNNNNCQPSLISTSLIDSNNNSSQQDEDNNNNNSFSSIRHSIRNSNNNNNININSSNNGISSIIHSLHRSFSRDDSDDDNNNNDSDDDNSDEDNSQFSKYSQQPSSSSNNLSIRASASKPIPIKKSQLRSSLNTSIDIQRGGLTPISK